jgi:hypothetical protein
MTADASRRKQFAPFPRAVPAIIYYLFLQLRMMVKVAILRSRYATEEEKKAMGAETEYPKVSKCVKDI